MWRNGSINLKFKYVKMQDNTKTQQPLPVGVVDCGVGSVDGCTLILAEVVTPVVNVVALVVSIGTEVFWEAASTTKVRLNQCVQYQLRHPAFQHENAPALT